MKKFLTIVFAVALVTGAYAHSSAVNEKVLKAFNETFTSAVDVKWDEYPTYYTVSFVHSGIQSKVNYDKQGKMLGSLRYYSPEMLPLNIINILKNDYPRKDLFGVTEVTFQSDVIYFVKMQDEKYWVTIKIDLAGNSEVYEKYKKDRPGKGK